MKMEASVWPADKRTDDERRQFIEENRAKGIIIDPLKVEYNPGRRYIAKLALNRYDPICLFLFLFIIKCSLWGRFCLRNMLNVVTDNKQGSGRKSRRKKR
jgi:hypothetical protein